MSGKGNWDVHWAVKHNHSAAHGTRPASPTYSSWQAMKARTSNPKLKAAPRYIGKGITVCERWKKFENFLADMGERPPGTTLDRFPNNRGNYEPGNCRWATISEQARNKPSVKLSFEIAVQIVLERMRGDMLTDIARRYSCTRTHVMYIFKGRVWKDALPEALRRSDCCHPAQSKD
jgi:hypothetical protein